MLDAGRNFFPVAFIKRYIDLMAVYKLNTFHWHLTEDQGWRIEIKKYPLLTSQSSIRKASMVGRYGDMKFDNTPYGGFYTQEDIKEVIAYADKKFITIIPEIEMPGHSQALLASYPQLGCNPDKIYEVATKWGVSEDVLCPREETFTFMENVLTEVMALFPGKYIHIGGDECPKTQWKQSRFCQDLIKKLGLKNEHELQSYFIRRIDKFITSKGKRMLGWDEILEGGLSPNAMVMSWRGTSGGIEDFDPQFSAEFCEKMRLREVDLRGQILPHPKAVNVGDQLRKLLWHPDSWFPGLCGRGIWAKRHHVKNAQAHAYIHWVLVCANACHNLPQDSGAVFEGTAVLAGACVSAEKLV